MKIEKKHWIIIAIVVILIVLWYFFMRKKATTTSKYAGTYGSFGNESGFDTQQRKVVDSLDSTLPMIGRESNYSTIKPVKSPMNPNSGPKPMEYWDSGGGGLGPTPKPGPYKGR